eukprot:1294745-Pyramimonas_sp.AAC.1
MKYMHFQQECKEAFREKWALAKQQTTSPSAPAAAAPAPPTPGARARPVPKPRSERQEALQNAAKLIKDMKEKQTNAKAIL